MGEDLFEMDGLDFAQSVADEPLRISLESLRSRLQIDTADLSDALVKQPVAYLEARELAIHLSGLSDQAKRRTDELLSRVYIDERKQLEESGVKATEAQVKARVDTNALVVEQHTKNLILKRAYGIAQALGEAFSQRGYMLKELVSLHGDQYRASDQSYDALRDAHKRSRIGDAK